MPKKERETSFQMHLEQAHPQGCSGYWNSPEADIRTALEGTALDPEKGINAMHDRYKRDKLLRQDTAYEWRQKLKRWGYTDANRRILLEENMKRAVKRLQEKGVWQLILRGLTFQERETIHEIVSTSEEPIRDLDSSEGFTIYPNETTWIKDIYGAK